MFAVFVFSVVVCLFGGTMAEDAVSVILIGSNSSSGSKGGLLGCKPLSTSSKAGPKVRFQAIRSGGVEYSRVLVASERMTSSDVVATNSNAKNIADCAKAATEKKWDGFSFVNGACVGYKIGGRICRCKKGDFVLFLAKGAKRSNSSARDFTAAKGRAAAAPPPIGYIRKLIYPSVSMTGANFGSQDSSCEAIIVQYGAESPYLLHTVNGMCYFTWAFTHYPCDDPCAGNAIEVLLKIRNETEIYLLSRCGRTITPTLYTEEDYDNSRTISTVIYSHEGYGCIPYPDPASDANCDLTVGTAGAKIIQFSINSNWYDIDESDAATCNGDQLYLSADPVDASKCTKKPDTTTTVKIPGDKTIIRFQRRPAHNRNSVNKGFFMDVLVFDSLAR